MAKAKAKKRRFVIGVGYPWLETNPKGSFVNLTLCSDAEGKFRKNLLNGWPGDKLGDSKYRIVLEEI